MIIWLKWKNCRNLWYRKDWFTAKYCRFCFTFYCQRAKNVQCPFVGVFGNNDGDHLFLLHQFQEIGQIYPGLHKTEIDGKKIIMSYKNGVIADLAKNNQTVILLYSLI